MANSYDRNALARLLAGLGTKPNSLADLVSPPAAPSNGLNALSGLFGSSPPSPFGIAPTNRSPVAPQNAMPGLGNPLYPYLPSAIPPARPFGSLAPSRVPAVPVATKRKGFFSFHYDDLMRVNNVRQSWKISHPDRELKRNFYDRSLWESTKRTDPEGLKALIRNGMKHSSAVCVMVGTYTWERPWVRYEIARAIVDEKGLFAVHINGLRHHQRRTPDPLGPNPLDYMGIYHAHPGAYHVYERFLRRNGVTGQLEWQWLPFEHYRRSVPLPKYMVAPQLGYVTPLSYWTNIYDYVTDRGSDNLGGWIDQAAKRAGR